MDMVPLQAAARDMKASPRALRRGGRVPCILYGNGLHQPIECEGSALQKAYEKAGESTLVALGVGEKHFPVLIHAVDFDPVSDRISHVDFYAVDMTKEIDAQVPLHFEGEVPALQQTDGIFVTVLDHVTVRCLPGNLPHALTVRREKLQALHDTLTIADIPLPAGVVILEEAAQVIATVQEPRKEEIPVEKPPEVPVEGEAAAAGGEVAAEGASEKKEAESGK